MPTPGSRRSESAVHVSPRTSQPPTPAAADRGGDPGQKAGLRSARLARLIEDPASRGTPGDGAPAWSVHALWNQAVMTTRQAGRIEGGISIRIDIYLYMMCTQLYPYLSRYIDMSQK